jgi:hypothetical protein
MSSKLPARFWFEAATAVVGGLLFVLTLVTREWIEILTGWDPDGGSGALELVIAVGLLALSLGSALGARRSYRLATA